MTNAYSRIIEDLSIKSIHIDNEGTVGGIQSV
jgi:hypothetical protein